MEAIDINLNGFPATGAAYYRLPDHFFEFLKKCEEKHIIIGFEWDGSRTFGVILKDKENQDE